MGSLRVWKSHNSLYIRCYWAFMERYGMSIDASISPSAPFGAARGTRPSPTRSAETPKATGNERGDRAGGGPTRSTQTCAHDRPCIRRDPARHVADAGQGAPPVHGGETPAVALESCAAELEATLQERDETTLSLTEAARESGYSTDHLGRLVRDGRIPNAGRPGAPRIARSILPRKTQAPATPLLVNELRPRQVSNAQIVQSIIERGIE